LISTYGDSTVVANSFSSGALTTVSVAVFSSPGDFHWTSITLRFLLRVGARYIGSFFLCGTSIVFSSGGLASTGFSSGVLSSTGGIIPGGFSSVDGVTSPSFSSAIKTSLDFSFAGVTLGFFSYSAFGRIPKIFLSYKINLLNRLKVIFLYRCGILTS